MEVNPNPKPSRYILVLLGLAIVTFGLLAYFTINRLQNPQALQSNSFAQEVPTQAPICQPKDSAGTCTGLSEEWGPGSPATCMKRGGIPMGGSCTHVCCKLAGRMPWGTVDSCSGLKGSKEVCEGFNSCPFNYMCKWDEITKTCGSSTSMANPWCRPTATPQPTAIPTIIPTDAPTPTLVECGDNGLDAVACDKERPLKAWYACACGGKGGCFGSDVNAVKICPSLWPTDFDICKNLTRCEDRPTYCAKSACGVCYLKSQPAPTCPPSNITGAFFRQGSSQSKSSTSANSSQ